MEPGDDAIPPSIQPAERPPSIGRWRWWTHLSLLTAYPIVLGALAAFQTGKRAGPMLPRASEELLLLAGAEVVIFGIVFLLAWLASRASAEQLYLRWRGGLWPFLRGLGYSIALRMIVAAVAIAAVVIAHLVFKIDEHGLKQALPHPEAVIDPAAMTHDPLYFWLMLTLISFGVAGLREELWRAGMLAGLQALFPRRFGSTAGGFLAVALVAVVFGLGHIPQGWGAVILTALLGIGLGAIIVWHRSIWDAVMAHGFFDATTFVMLYWLSKLNPQFLNGGG